MQLIIIQNNSTHHTEDVLITKFLGEEVLQRVVKAVIIHMTNKDWLINLLLLLLSHFSRVRLSVTPETAAHQAPPSLGFSKQELDWVALSM